VSGSLSLERHPALGIPAEARRPLFAVTPPLGHRVVLSRNRWREIVRFKHPALAGQEGEVRDCLRDPEVIRTSAKDPEIHLYYRSAETGYICVVVAGANPSERFVVTAYYTQAIKQGNTLWTK
jgi:hypothetical protein